MIKIGDVVTVELKEGFVTDAVVDSEYNKVEGGYWAVTSEGEDVVVNEVNVIGY
jgi:hypothetical protein